MLAYNQFAQVYDHFMATTPYETWADFIMTQIQKYHITPKLMCDLGCGTGKMCMLFAEKGIEMIGIDSSEEMLMIAKEHAMEKQQNILYLLQDMSEFELYGTVDVIYSCCDSINYLLEDIQLKNMFQWVNNYLEPKGLFIFDINTPYKYEKILGDQTFAEQTEDAAYIWENYYDEESQINEFVVNFFIQQENELYERTEEYHYQRAYEVSFVKDCMEKAGLECLAIYDDYTSKPYHSSSTRVTFVAREKGKEI